MNIIEPKSQSGKENVSSRDVLDVGLALRRERERQGMSVHDIAERIKFAPKQVEALEANDFVHLPQATFLRGFVRSYARVLQLDETVLIAALPVDKPKQAGDRTQSVNVSFPNKLMLQRINLLWLVGALGVGVVLALFLLLNNAEPLTRKGASVLEPVPLPVADMASAVANAEVGSGINSEQTKPVSVVEQTQSVASPARVVEPANKPEPVHKPEPAKVVESTKIVAPPVMEAAPIKKPSSTSVIEPGRRPKHSNNNEAVKSALMPEAASAPAAVAKPGLPLEVLMRRPLHFVFAEAMFVEVIDAHGSVLISRNVSRGDEKWIGGPGRAPYDVSISKPGKAKLYYKGKVIDLSVYPPAEITHLKVQ